MAFFLTLRRPQASPVHPVPHIVLSDRVLSRLFGLQLSLAFVAVFLSNSASYPGLEIVSPHHGRDSVSCSSYIYF